jgi:hypothetical protein
VAVARVVDVETYLGQVWNSDVRPLAQEAWRCYNAGAIRASIAATWTAVAADIITKLIRLANDGDKEAAPFHTSVTNAQQHGITAPGVQAMQRIEDVLLSEAKKFELIDTIGSRELERIREDRNLCVHPSLRILGDVYEPRPEVARGHLAVALATLLIHPPTQGRKAIEEFTTYICDPYFVAAVPHIQATFFDRVRTGARGNIVKVAAKHALLETAPPPSVQLPSAELANRMAAALSAFASRDRELVRSVVTDLHSRFQLLDGAAQLRALVRLGDRDYFWDMIDEAMAVKFNAMLDASIVVNPWEALPADVASCLALVRSELARARLPILEDRFTRMSFFHRISIAAAHPDPYFVPAVVDFVRGASSFRTGEQAGQLAVQHAAYLNVEILQSVLAEWVENYECREASLMPGMAVELFLATAHLGTARVAAFKEFLARAQAVEEVDPYYRYPALEATLHSAGYL